MGLAELKEEFEDVSEALVEKAWGESEGPEAARELLQPRLLVIQGKYRGANQDPGLLFQIDWNLEKEFKTSTRGVVASPSTIDDIHETQSYEVLKSKIQTIADSETSLGGLTKEFSELLRNKFKPPDENIMGLLETRDLESIKQHVLEELAENFKFQPGEVITNFQTVPAIQMQENSDETEDSDDSEEDEAEVNFKCQIEVNPTRGLSFDRLQVGDDIYVEIDDTPNEPREQKAFKSLTTNKMNETIGMIPARLTTIEEKESGDLELTVKFEKNVTGTLHCSPNVNILCPDTTLEKRGENPQNTDNLNSENLLLNIWPMFLLLGFLFLLFFLIFMA